MKYFVIIALLFFFGCEKEKIETNKPLHVKQEKPLHVNIQDIKSELQNIDSLVYLERYIMRVINEGADGSLGFPAGAMDAGYAYKSDAPDIAKYVVTLANKKSSDDIKAKAAALFYTSNCGGCHGDDGKGLSGAFPDLTLNTLQGIQKRKEFLKIKLNTLTNK